MKIKGISILIIAFLSLSFGLPKKIQKKVDKAIKITYEIENYAFNAITIPENVAKELPSKFQADNFFEIKSEENLLGYAYIAKAPSKTAQFDYLVLLDEALVVKKAKVLVYREEYGGEIGSKRWLKQFIGKTGDHELQLNNNIIAISGATISVRSMTDAMNDLLQSLKIINAKGIL